MEYPIGTIITGSRVNFNRGRIAALCVIGLGVALFARTGTAITIHSITSDAAGGGTIRGGTGGSSHTGNVHGGAGGGGTIYLGG